MIVAQNLSNLSSSCMKHHFKCRMEYLHHFQMWVHTCATFCQLGGYICKATCIHMDYSPFRLHVKVTICKCRVRYVQHFQMWVHHVKHFGNLEDLSEKWIVDFWLTNHFSCRSKSPFANVELNMCTISTCGNKHVQHFHEPWLYILKANYKTRIFDFLIFWFFDFWFFDFFDFLIFWLIMSYFIEGQWKTDKDNRMSGHMTIIPFPVSY